MPQAPAGPTDHRRPGYRADIDGLRAVAVAAVVLYHAHVPGFAGGYLGVDVFFVISGFLITQLLVARAQAPRLPTLADFYLRRARRLLPALFVVLAACTLAAVTIDLPEDLRNFGRSLMLAVTFLGNFGAALHGGYFDPGARFAPLRHLWSLGVEEQFYLLYPLALFAIAGLRSNARIALLALAAVVSLLLAVRGAVHEPVLNFFMLPTRAWELMAGALVALSPLPGRVGPGLRQSLAAAALVSLLFVVHAARAIGFPGIGTVAATAATAALLAANVGQDTLVARLLSLRPIVFTGLISYSLYLWHAPVISFYEYYNILEPSRTALAVILGLVYLLSALTWLAVEQPFRTRRWAAANRGFVALSLLVGMLFIAVGYALVRADGWPQRWSAPLPRIAEESPALLSMETRCSGLPLSELAAGHLCSFGPQNDVAPRVIVWGDSHAGVLLPVYQSLADARGIRVYFAVRGACWPLPGAEAAGSGEFWRARCARFNDAMLQAIDRINPQRVILNAYWLDPGADTESELRTRALGRDTEMTSAIDELLTNLRSHGRAACAVLTVPGYRYPIPYALAMAQRRGLDPQGLAISRAQALGDYRMVEGALRARADQRQLRVADPKDVLCPGEQCRFRAPDGTLLYRDANHLAPAGARYVAKVIEQCLDGMP